jgi:hypothetical protein
LWHDVSTGNKVSIKRYMYLFMADYFKKVKYSNLRKSAKSAREK